AKLSLFFSTHSSARLYQLRASSFWPSCQWAMARKKKSKASPPLRSSIDFSRAAMASFHFPALYWAAPSVFQYIPSCGTNSTAFLDSVKARPGSRNFGSGQVASNQAALLLPSGLVDARSSDRSVVLYAVLD